MASKSALPTLDLSTLSENAPIRIDRVEYAVRHPETLALAEYKQLESELPRLGQLMLKAHLTPDESKEAKRLLNSVIGIVLAAPDEVKAKLTDVQRVLILNLFTQLQPSGQLTAPLAEATQTTTRRRSTGGKRSRR